MNGSVNGDVTAHGAAEAINGVEGVNGQAEGGAGAASGVVNGNGLHGAEAEAMEMEGGQAGEDAALKVEPMKVEAEMKEEKPEVSFYQEEKAPQDESLVDEVGAMSDLVQNYFKVGRSRAWDHLRISVDQCSIVDSPAVFHFSLIFFLSIRVRRSLGWGFTRRRR